jgi:arabinose-5-phosphate isomerase
LLGDKQAAAAAEAALGDALAVALILARSVGVEEFGRYHPGGQLGSALRQKVEALWRKLSNRKATG